MGGRLLFLGHQLLDCWLWDIVLPKVWRILGPTESVMGVLMCGISVSALFAVATRLVEAGDPVLGDNQNSAPSVPRPVPESDNLEKVAMPLRMSP